MASAVTGEGHESGSEPEKWDPHTRETADHSLPYVFARALRYGGIDDRSYELSAIREQATLELMRKVEVVPDWSLGSIAPTVIGARVEAVDIEGQPHTVSITKPRGHFANPMTREEISSKARGLIEPVLGPATEPAIAAAWGVESQRSIASVLETFVRTAGSQERDAE